MEQQVGESILKMLSSLEETARSEYRETSKSLNEAKKAMSLAEKAHLDTKSKVGELEQTLNDDALRIERRRTDFARMKEILWLLSTNRDTQDEDGEYGLGLVERAKRVLCLHEKHETGLPNGNSHAIGSEYIEFLDAMENGSEEDIAGEYGDLLTNVLLTGLQMGLSPEKCVKVSTDKMSSRIRYINDNCTVPKNHAEYSGEVVRLWNEAKGHEHPRRTGEKHLMDPILHNMSLDLRFNSDLSLVLKGFPSILPLEISLYHRGLGTDATRTLNRAELEHLSSFLSAALAQSHEGVLRMEDTEVFGIPRANRSPEEEKEHE
jgi:hypothetical protein